jgi:hypothetical protein
VSVLLIDEFLRILLAKVGRGLGVVGIFGQSPFHVPFLVILF